MGSRGSRAVLGAVLLVASLAGGCHRRPSAVDSGTDAGLPDAGPPPPPELALTLDTHFEDGGSEHVELFAGRAQELSPAQHLTVTSNRRLGNVRVRLFDESDKALESNDTSADDPDGGLRYEVSLLGPLKSGHRYGLVLDAQEGVSIVDEAGRPLPEQRFELQTLGERVKDAPAGSSKHRRRRK